MPDILHKRPVKNHSPARCFACFALRTALACSALALPVSAQPVNDLSVPDAPASAPGSVKTDGDLIKIGDRIAVIKSRRAISFPAWVNQAQGVIEYAVVMRSGKTHEALFATDAGSRDLHAAALLLNVAPEEIITKPNEPWLVPNASAIDIEITWDLGGKKRTYPLSDLVVLRNEKTKDADEKFPSQMWWYNGSRLIEGGAFVAQTGGSIVSLIFDPDALINNPGIDRNDDDIHFINTAFVPPVNTPVTITMRLSRRTVDPAPKEKAENKENQTDGPRSKQKAE
jgi:hypothetical protein